jgi:hypothetical protein
MEGARKRSRKDFLGYYRLMGIEEGACVCFACMSDKLLVLYEHGSCMMYDTYVCFFRAFVRKEIRQRKKVRRQ